MASTIQVGVLRAQLTADTAQFVSGFRTAGAEVTKFQKQSKASTDWSSKMIAGMSEAGKAASASSKMIAGMSLAGRQAAASQAAAAQAAQGWAGRLRGLVAPLKETFTGSQLLGGSITKLIGAFGAVSVISSVANFIKTVGLNALEAASRLSDMSAKTGISASELQRMEFVAEQTGTTLEAFSKASFQLGIRIEGGSKKVTAALSSLGLEHKKLKDLKLEQQWAIVVEAMEKEENQNKRNTAGVALMGKVFEQVAPAIAQGYSDIAKAAKTSGDVQIAALDAAGDALARLKKNAEATSVQIAGTLALAVEGLRQAGWVDRLKALAGVNVFAGDLGAGLNALAGNAVIAADAAKRLKEEQIKAAKAAADAGTATASYSAQLKQVKIDLAALTPAQRAEIAAAQALGADMDVLLAKYDLTEMHLRVLNTQTVESSKATKEAAKSAKEAAAEYKAWTDAVADVTHDMHKLAVELNSNLVAKAGKQAEETADAQLGAFNRRMEAEREAATTSKDIEFQRAEFAIEQARRNGASWQELYAMEQRLSEARLQRAIDAAKLEFQVRTMWIDRTTAFGEAEYFALEQAHNLAIQSMVEQHQQGEILKRQELERTNNKWRESFEILSAGFKDIQNELTGNLGTLLFNFGHDMDGTLKKTAADAKREYDKIKADGKATPDAIHAAFERMREAEDRANVTFGERFVSVWHSIKSRLFKLFDDILGHFVNSFLKGMLNSMTGQKGAFQNAFGGLLSGGGGGGGIPGVGGSGGLLGKIPGLGGLFGGGAAAATAGGVLASSTVPTALAMTAVPGIGLGVGGAAGATAGAAGAAGAGGGLGATIGALATNPFTIAAAAGIVVGLAVWKKGLFRGGEEGTKVSPRRDKFIGQFGPSGTGPGSGFATLAGLLTRFTGEAGGGSLFRALNEADTVKEYDPAQAAIATLLKKNKVSVQQFLFGGLVKGFGAMPIMAHGGEGILSRLGMQHIGGEEGLKSLNTGGVPSVAKIVNVTLNVQAWDHMDAARWLRTQGIPELKRALLLNTGDFGTAVKGAA